MSNPYGGFCFLNVLLHYFPRATMLYNTKARHNAEVWKDINSKYTLTLDYYASKI